MISIEEVQKLFTDTFLENAPIYKVAKIISISPSKNKFIADFPTPDAKPEYWRVLQEIMDYETFFFIPVIENASLDEEIKEKTKQLAIEAAHLVDGLLKIEIGPNPRYDFQLMKRLMAIDIFKYSDGEPNLKIDVVTNVGPIIVDPCGLIPGWVSYKFLFAGIYV